MINKFYEASAAGVKIKLIVRGMCSLVAGVKGVSENIEAIAIIDKFLEHSRVFVFYNGGNEKYYLSSADWMDRNFDQRSEVAVPIYDIALQKQLRSLLDILWLDNTKARILDSKQKNEYRPTNNKKKVRAQEEIYNFLKSTKNLKYN
jgi:polyphosphate kinase